MRLYCPLRRVSYYMDKASFQPLLESFLITASTLSLAQWGSTLVELEKVWPTGIVFDVQALAQKFRSHKDLRPNLSTWLGSIIAKYHRPSLDQAVARCAQVDKPKSLVLRSLILSHASRSSPEDLKLVLDNEPTSAKRPVSFPQELLLTSFSLIRMADDTRREFVKLLASPLIATHDTLVLTTLLKDAHPDCAQAATDSLFALDYSQRQNAYFALTLCQYTPIKEDLRLKSFFTSLPSAEDVPYDPALVQDLPSIYKRLFTPFAIGLVVYPKDWPTRLQELNAYLENIYLGSLQASLREFVFCITLATLSSLAPQPTLAESDIRTLYLTLAPSLPPTASSALLLILQKHAPLSAMSNPLRAAVLAHGPPSYRAAMVKSISSTNMLGERC